MNERLVQEVLQMCLGIPVVMAVRYIGLIMGVTVDGAMHGYPRAGIELHYRLMEQILKYFNNK